MKKTYFSQNSKAKLAFPVLYETSPEQDARHEISNIGAAREEAEALHKIEALVNAAVEGAGAEAFEFEAATLNDKRKLSTAFESIDDATSNVQGKVSSI